MKKSDFIILGLVILLIYFLSKGIGKTGNEAHLQKLDPSARDIFEGFLNDIKHLGYTPVIRDSTRTFEQQAYYKKQDPRNASPGHSSHEIGTAIDLDIYKNGKVWSKKTSSAAWRNTGIPQLASQYKIRWGGNFKGYADNNHFDLLT